MNEILQPPGWASPLGYSAGMSASGRIVVTAGQVGWDPRMKRFETADFAKQAAQALRNVVAVLHAGDAVPKQLVRLTWYITSAKEYTKARRDIGLAYREIIGDHYPAMSVIVVTALLEPEAKVEIEATAVVPLRPEELR